MLSWYFGCTYVVVVDVGAPAVRLKTCMAFLVISSPLLMMMKILPRYPQLTDVSLQFCASDIGLYLSVERNVDSDFCFACFYVMK